MLHVSCGTTATRALRRRAPSGEYALRWPDVLAYGPLADADQIDPQLRTAHWLRLLRAYPAAPDADEAWQRARGHACRTLLQAWECKRPITLWLEHGASDALLLRLLAAQCPADTPLAVIDVGHKAANASAPRTLAWHTRQALARDWARWQDAGDGVRDMVDGSLRQRPLSCYDAALLATLAQHGPLVSTRLVAQTRAAIGSARVCAHFLRWRLLVLHESGQLAANGHRVYPAIAA